MRSNILKHILLFSSACFFWSCTSEPADFGEQYKKTLYIVNSRDMLYVGEHAYGSENNSMQFSVYCASSEPIKSDLTVQLEINPKALDSLNKKSALGNPLYTDKQLLPKENYTSTNLSVTIRANEQYGVLDIPFDPQNLDPDVSYALPITIASNSAGYDVNEELSTMVYEVKMINGFSGDFAGSSIELPKTIRSVQPVLKAISSNSIRMPIHTLSGEAKYIKTNFMLLNIGTDSTSVTIKPWLDAKITDSGKSYYDRKKQSFYLRYTYTNEEGETFDIEEKIININAPVTDTEEQ